MKDSGHRIALCLIIAFCWFVIGIFIGNKTESDKWHKYWDQILATGVGVRPGPVPFNRAIKVCSSKQSNLLGMTWFYKSPPPTWVILCLNGHAYDLAAQELKDER